MSGANKFVPNPDGMNNLNFIKFDNNQYLMYDDLRQINVAIVGLVYL